MKKNKAISFFAALLFLLTFTGIEANAQTPGLIYKPSSTRTGRLVLDPDSNGYTSATTAGFVGTDYGAQSELKMIAIPIVTAEPVGDLTTGGSGGQTDIVGDSHSVFILNDGKGNFIVRFRIGKNSTATKGYSLLIDNNGLVGPSDPNYTSSNPGFEREIVLETNKRVAVYNLVAGHAVGDTVATYNVDSHQQRSVAVTTYDSSPDYFYDFYVPASVLGSGNLRFAATTITSGSGGGATVGTISDINGINDSSYGGNEFAALLTAVASFPPTPVSSMTSGYTFPASLSIAPVITSSLTTSSTSISGTSTEANGTTITLYRKVGAGSYTSIGTTTVSSSAWSWTISGITLAANDLIKATATASGKSESAASNIVTVSAAPTCYTAPPTAAAHVNGQQTVAITWTWPSGVTPAANTAQVRAYQQTPGSNTFTEITNSTVGNQYLSTAGTLSFDTGLGQSTFNSTTLYFTVTYGGCTSLLSNPSTGSGVTTTTAPTITTTSPTVNTTTITVKNLNSSGNAILILYKNGVEVTPRPTTGVALNGTNDFTVSGLAVGDVFTARAQSTAANGILSNPSATVTVSAASATQSTAPVISGNYYTNSTSVTGTSVEQSGSTITLYDNGTQVGTTTVNNYGNWTVTGLTLTAGHAMTAKVTALGKSISAASNSVTVINALSTSVPAAPSVDAGIQAGQTTITGTGGSGTVTVYVDGQALNTVTNANGVWSLSVASTDIYKGASITATNTNTTTLLTSAYSNAVIATGVDHFKIEANGGGNIGTQIAGTPFLIQISAQNSSNTLFNTYTGTNVVNSASTIIAGNGPTNAFSAGVLTGHSLTLTTAGNYTVTTVSTSDPTAVGTSNIFVINSNPVSTKLSIKTQPSSTATSETYFAQQPAVYILDQYGNIRTGDNGTVVTASILPNTATLNGQLTATTVNGVATFSGLSITGAGTDSLSFTSPGLTGKVSTPITVSANSPAAPSALSYTTPNVYTVGTAITALTPTVTGTVASYSVSPALPAGLSINVGTGVISGTPTAATATALYTVTARNSGGTKTFDISITVNSIGATQLAITTQPSSTAQSGIAFAQPAVVQLQDGSGNAVSQAGVAITASIASGGGTLGGTVTVNTDANGKATFTDLNISGTIGNRTLTFASTGLTSVTSGTIALTAGTATAVKVETAADGSGTVISAQNLASGSTLTAYAITRDANGNFVANVAANSWSLTNKTSGVVDGDLVAAGDNKSATLTGKLIGTANISTTSGALAVTPSGTITVVAGSAASINVETAANGSGTLVSAQNLTSGSTLTAFSITRDAAGNFVANAAGTWSLTNKTGGIANSDLVAAGDNKSAVLTGNKIGTTNISATSGVLTANTSGTITVVAGSAASINVETAANGSGTLVSAQNLTSGGTLTAYSITRDAAGNFVANAAGIWSLTNKTGGLANGDLVAAGDNKSAVLTGNKIGTTNISVTSGVLTANTSGTITVVAGSAASINVETAANGSGTLVSAQNLTSGGTLTAYSITRDAAGNFVANAAGIWSLTNKTGGLVNGDLVAAGDNKSAVLTGNKIGTTNISATSGVLTANTSGTITVVAGSAASINVETAANGSGTLVSAQNLTSGSTLTAFSITRDAAGNFVANAAGTWSLTNKTGGLANGDLVAAGDNKSAVLTGNKIGTTNISATSGVLTANTSGTITVVAGSAASINVETAANGSGVLVSAQNLTSGGTLTAYSITRDAAGNFVANAAGIWSLTNKTGGLANGDLVAAGDNKSATMTGNLLGTANISATSGVLTANTSGTITVVAGSSATKLAISTQPSTNAQSGIAFTQQPVIQLQDVNSNPVHQSGVTVTASITGGVGAFGGTVAVNTDANGVATFSDLNISGLIGTYTLTFTSSPLTSVTSGNISLAAGAAASIAAETAADGSGNTITAQNLTSGSTITAYAITRDASGNFVANAAATWALTNKTAGVADADLVAAVNTKSAVLTGKLVGTANISATSTGLTATASGTITIIPGTANQLAISIQPSTTAQNGAAFATQPVIQIQDANGNVVTGDNSTTVTAAITSPGTGTLGTTLTVTAHNGVATFSGLSITGLIGDRTLTFTSSPSLSSATSNTISITAGAAASIAAETAANGSGSVISAQNLSSGSTLTAYAITRDASGNFVANATATWALTNKTAGVADADLVAAVNTKSAVLTGKLVGTANISATSTGLNATTSGTITITPGTATQLAISTQPSTTAQNGAAFATQPVIQIQDANGNVVTGDNSTTVTAAITSPGTGTLGTTLTVTAHNGVATFSGLNITGLIGDRTLTFTSSPSLSSATSNTISITAGAAASIAAETAADGSGNTITAQNLASGSTLTAYAITRDASGNFVANTAASWALTNKTAGVADADLVAAVNTKSAVLTGKLVGTANISATSTGLTATSSGAITVVAGAASKLAIATQPSVSAPPTISFAQQPVIQLKDAAGNDVSAAGTTVTVSVATGAGTLGGTLTATTNASGVATFSGLKITGLDGDRTLQFSSTGLTGITSNTINITLNLAVTVSSQTNVIAYGASTGAVTVSAVGGTSPYQYKIGTSSLQNSPTFNGLAAGTYTVTVSDANSVTSTVSVTITQPSAALAVNISSQTNVIAYGASTGAVTVVGTGGTSPYQYKIGSGSLQNSATFSGLAAGTYVVTVQDANSVTSTVSVTITQPSAALAVNISSQTNVIAYGASTGAVTVIGTGGTSPYQYKIGTGSLQNSPTFTGLAAGTYTVTVSDANSVTSTVSVTITQPSAALAVNISSQTNVIAYGASTGAVTVVGTGGTSPYQYQIGTGSLQNSPTFTGLAAGTYTVTVSDANSVTSTVSVTITQPSAALAVNISSQTNVIAYGASTGAVTVVGTGGTSPYQYKIGSGSLQNSATFSGLAAGTYTVTVSDANSVTSTVSVTITQPSAALAVNISSQTNVIAYGASTGAVTVVGTGGTSPYQYQIGTGSLQNSPTFTGLAAGTYTITVSDANSITSTVSVTITQPSAALAVNISSQTNVIAYGASTGAVTVVGTGGTGPYQYKIGNGSLQSSGTFGSLAAGTYVVTVQDANGVTSTVNVTITQPSAALAVNISSQTNVIAYGASTGAVTVVGTGGTSPYQYQIGTGSLQNSPTFTGLAAGTYVMTVQDANSVTSTVSVTITQPSAALAVNISSQTNVIAYGASTGAVTVVGTGGTSPYQYKIGTGSLQNSPTFTGLAAGTYTVTVSDANSVTSTVSVTITQPSAALAVNISSQTNVIAYGASTGAVTVIGTGGTSPYQYKIGTGSLQNSPTFTGLAAGTYTVTVSDANSVTSTVSVTITQPSAALAVNISSQTNVIAYGASTGAVTVVGTGGTSPYQFKMGTGSLQNSPTFTGLAAGTYTVTVSDANSVTSTVSVTITQPSAALAVNISSQTNVIAYGASTGAVTVVGTGGTSPYQYKTGTGSLQNSPTFTGLAAGTYVVTVQDANGVTSTVNVTITQPSAALAVNISSQTNVIAYGASTGAVTVVGTGGTSPYQFKIGTGSLQNSPTFTGLAAGTYTVTVSDANSVTSTVSVTITQPSAALAVNISSQTNVIAYGASTGAVTVVGTGGTSPYQYQIGTGSLQNSPTFTGLAAGTYTVTVSDANSVTSTVSVTITQPSAALAVNISSQTNVIAYGASTGAVTVIGTGGTSPYQYKIGTGSLQNSPTFTGLAAGTYTITVSDANSITSTVSVTITQPSAALAVNISSQTNVIAYGASTGAVTVIGTGGTSPYQYKTGTGSLQNSPTFTGLAAGTYVVTVQDANGVTSTVSVTITQPSAALAVNISSQTNVIAYGASTGAVTVVGTGGTGPYQYKIGNGSLQSSGTFGSLAAGTYVVTVQDANGVTSTVSVTIGQPSAALAVNISSQTNVIAYGASTGAVTVVGTGGTGPYQFKIGAGNLQSSGSFSGLVAGSYVVTVRDANGVTSTVNVIITQPSAALAVNISSQTNVNPGGSLGAVTVTGTGGTGPYQYKIGNGSLQSSGTFTGLSAGTYIITVSDTNGVTSTVTVTINQLTQVITFAALPAKTYGNADFAPGATSNNNTIPIVYASSNTAVATIVNGNIHIVGAGSAIITASQAGDANNTAAANVTQTLTVAKANLTVTAVDKTRQYAAANPAFNVTYAGFVNGDDASKLSTAAVASSAANASSLPGNYSIIASGAWSSNYSFTYVNGTLKITGLSDVTLVNLVPSVGTLSPTFNSGTFNYNISVGYDVSAIYLIPTYVGTATATINGVPVPNGTASYNILLNNGNNVITIVITAQDGITKKTYRITVYKALKPVDIIPTNVLTPNGDGKNDAWVVKDIELYPENKVSIFDRAGRPIYTKKGYTNDWDGTLNGSVLTQGTYYYIIELAPGMKPIKGFITILKSK